MNFFRRMTLAAALLSVLFFTGCTKSKATPVAVPNTGGIQPGMLLNVPATIPLPGQRQPVVFQAGADSVIITQTLQTGVPVAYQFQAKAGQHLYLAVNGSAKYQVYDPNGAKLSGVLVVPGPVNILLDQEGNYYVVLSGQGHVTMSLYLPAVAADSAGPLPANLKMIDLAPADAAAGVSLSMTAAQPVGFTFTGLNDQPVLIKTGGQATVMLVTPDNEIVEPSGTTPGQWEFSLPEGGRYTVVIFGRGLVQVNLQQSPVPEGVPTAIPRPASSTRLTFPTGQSITTLHENLSPTFPRAYVLTLQQGQSINVLAGGQTSVSIYSPAGSSLTLDHAQNTNGWSILAYQSGDYTVVVAGSGPTTLTFNVPPLGQ